MLVVLTQKLAGEPVFTEELFNTYHFPARYRNQIHKGDIFVYYQGNRYDKDQRFYFGVGTIGDIFTADGENYYAKLLDCCRFEKKVSIYLPDGSYVEQLGDSSARNSTLTPWQSSVRSLSQEAYDYILNSAGTRLTPGSSPTDSLDALKHKLKVAVRDFYVERNASAIYRVESIAAAIGRATSTSASNQDSTSEKYKPWEDSESKFSNLLNYCKTMRMSYSYKPVLILALLHAGNSMGCISIDEAATYFRAYYTNRKKQGLCAEKKRCIFLRDDITDKQIIEVLIANPVRTLVDCGFFFYNEEAREFSASPEIWSIIDRGKKSILTRICNQRLNEYYSS